MKKIHRFLGTLTITALILSSCKKDEVTPTPSPATYTVPTSYEFKNASNISTVDFSGQKTRLEMLDQISSLMGGATPITQEILIEMFDGKNFTDATLTSSGKKLSDKTAASIDYFSGYNLEKTEIITKLKSQFKEVVIAMNSKAIASADSAGYYMDGTKKRYFSPNGLEPQQVFVKGMMGACLLDQIVNNYLSKSKLDADANSANNTNKVVEAGKTYTTMEHAWDEAYGYIYGNDNLAASPAVYKFWSSYINQVNADPNFNTVKEAISKAFIKGRAAISNADYSTRDAQVAIIKTELAKVPAVRAVYYLNEGKTKLGTSNGKTAFHALSEAYGFIWCLRFTQNPTTKTPYFSKEEVDVMLADLMKGKNGLYDVDYLNTALDAIATKIASRFGFTVAQAIDATK
jgi:hypothetical protein